MRKNKLIVSLAVGSVLASLSGMALAANGIVHEPQLSTASVKAATRESNHCSAPTLSAINMTPELEVAFLPGADHMRPELMLASQNDEGELFGPLHKLEFVAAEQTLRPWQTSPMLAANGIDRPWQTSPMLAAEGTDRPWQTLPMLASDDTGRPWQTLPMLAAEDTGRPWQVLRAIDITPEVTIASQVVVGDQDLLVAANGTDRPWQTLPMLASGNAEGELFGPWHIGMTNAIRS